LAAGGYLWSFGPQSDLRRLARFGYALMSATTVVAAAELLHLLLTHQFQAAYVFNYTSRDLPFFYLFSAFWAGQEGTFLLWALIGAGLGLLLKLKAGEREAPVMFFFSLVQLCLFVLLLLKSPFEALETKAGVPVDGNGLNPLLQNPWMVLHPPLLFLGYAGMVLPFVWALTALVRREYDAWIAPALPWTLLAWVALGAGIIVGGYWAYETLGWGGYWGWDPVENASLLPWLVSTALLHSLLHQKATGSLRRTNLVLAILSFVLVLYGSYLTRSGVLGDFSVHSFQELGAGFNFFLIAFLLFPLVAGAVLLGWRWREMGSPAAFEQPYSRSFFVYLTVLLLLVCTGLIWVGTSAPVLTGLFTAQPRSVEPSYYNKVSTPLGVLLTALLGLCPLLAWRRPGIVGAPSLWRRPLGFALLGSAGTVGSLLLFARHSTDPPPSLVSQVGEALLWTLFIGLSLFVAAQSFFQARRQLRTGQRLHLGAPLAHLGLALTFIGIIASSAYESKRNLALPLGEEKTAFGRTFVYRGLQERADGKAEVKIDVARGETVYRARPRMFWSDKGLMKTPAIQRGWREDVYVEPDEIVAGQAAGTLTVAKGQTGTVSDYTVTFQGFDMRAHGEKRGGMQVGAALKVERGGKEEQITPVFDGRQSPPVSLRVGAASVAIERLNADRGEVTLRFTNLENPVSDQPETAIVWVTVKPLMSVLWGGCLLLLGGGSLAIYRRAREASAGPIAEAPVAYPLPPWQ